MSCISISIGIFTDASSLVAISISLSKLGSRSAHFVYESHLIVDEILPVAGTTAGGTDANFWTRLPRIKLPGVFFGNGTFVEAQYVNSNEIVCTSPGDMKPGLAQVMVSTNGKEFLRTNQWFRIQQVPHDYEGIFRI